MPTVWIGSLLFIAGVAVLGLASLEIQYEQGTVLRKSIERAGKPGNPRYSIVYGFATPQGQVIEGHDAVSAARFRLDGVREIETFAAVRRRGLELGCCQLSARLGHVLQWLAVTVNNFVRAEVMRRRIPNDRIEKVDDVHSAAHVLATGERGTNAHEAANRR